MTKRTGIAAVIALVVVAVGVAVAQPRMHDGGGRGHRKMDEKTVEALKGLHQTMTAWTRTNVLPQVRTWKSELDGAMSAADLATLNGLRARAKALQTERASLMAEVGTAWKNGDKEAAKAGRQKMKDIGEKHRALARELKPLAEKYSSTLKTIGAEARPKAKEWRSQGRDVAMKWLAEHRSEFTEEQMEHLQHGIGFFGGGHGGRHGKGMKGKRGLVVRFMLWDGSDFTEHSGQGMPGMDGGLPNLR